MSIESILTKIPEITAWIEELLATHAHRARSVASVGFQRLPQFYTPAFLDSAKFVPVEKIPVPPLSALGIRELEQFEKGDYAGITFKDTYFVQESLADDESLHFHELVHVVQWKHLGVQNFLTAYATGLVSDGYRDSPLEAMAYDLQTSFEEGCQPFSIESEVINRLKALKFGF